MAANPKVSDDDLRNFTLRVSGETIRLAKVAAAKRGTSVSSLFTELIHQLKDEKSETYEAARKRAIARIKQGMDFGGPGPFATRDELYDR